MVFICSLNSFVGEGVVSVVSEEFTRAYRGFRGSQGCFGEAQKHLAGIKRISGEILSCFPKRHVA